MRGRDWSRSSLGPVENWSQSLVGALSICFNCQFPIAIYWGPDKILFYNDAWRPIVGNKHPDSFGKPAREVWPEIWDVIGPLFKKVDDTGLGTFSANQLLLMHRFGYTEECYFDFTFSPIKESNGVVGGIFNAVLETTFRTISERRSKTLSDLAAKVSYAMDAEEDCRFAASVLDENPADIPLSLVYLARDTVDAESKLQFVASSGIDATDAALIVANLGDETVGRIFQHGQTEILDDFSARFGPISGKAWPEKIESALAIPMVRKGQRNSSVMGVVILGVSPRRELDKDYRSFFEQTALHLSTRVLTALTHQEERKRTEALAELDRAKTAFFSNVSHEFRTPLTLMLGPIEDSLADTCDPLSQRQRERQELSYRNALRLLKLVNSLLDFSRIEAGRANASFRPSNLAKLTTDLAGFFRSAIENAGLKFVVETEPLDEPVYVDQEMWDKIVLNLLSNAFKFTHSGEIALSLRKEGRFVRLSIRDTGIGIPESELPRIFERFHRVEGTQGRSHEGSGIGLALLQELIKLHGGTVRAESTLGKGSTFIVDIPLGKEHLAAEQIRDNEMPFVGKSLGNAFVEEALRWLPSATEIIDASPEISSHSADRSKFRVLLADDNADMRSYVRSHLAEHMHVSTVEDGEAAFEVAKSNPPDLILSDVMMPKVNGFELLKKLRSDPSTKSIPLILLSARAGEEATIEGLNAGADDYLVKPFSAKELIARVDTQLRLLESRKETEAERTKLNALFMQAPAAITLFRGPDYVIELMNQHSRSLHGGFDFTGKTLQEAFPNLVEQGFKAIFDDIFRTGVTRTFIEVPARLRQPDGSFKTLYFNTIYQPWRHNDGSVVGILTFSTDVTKQVLAGREIQALLNSSPAFFGFVDATSKVLTICNDLALRMIGGSPEEVFGKVFWECPWWSPIPASAVRIRDAVENAARGIRSEFDVQYWASIDGSEGQIRWTTFRTDPIMNDAGEIEKIAASGVDITDRKEAEIKLADALRLRDEFLSIASHELKTPITSIKLQLQMTKRRIKPDLDQVPSPEKLASVVETSLKQTDRLANLVEDLLDVSRIQAGKLEFNFEEMDLAHLIQEVEDQQCEQLEGTKCPIHVHITDDLKPHWDRSRIEQVVANLVSNSLKYAPDSPIRIEAFLQENNITLSVQDSGPGISKENQLRIFERFERATTSRNISGLGLGLYIVNQIVKGHQGSIRVESEQGLGTKFIIEMPVFPFRIRMESNGNSIG